MKPNGVAKRLRGTSESVPEISSIGTVVCGKCGQRFAINSELAQENSGLAEKQAAWLAERFVWDHIQERKHQGTIDLPDLQ